MAKGGVCCKGGGVCMVKGGMRGKGGHVWQRGACVVCTPPHEIWPVIARAVRILLECILVLTMLDYVLILRVMIDTAIIQMNSKNPIAKTHNCVGKTSLFIISLKFRIFKSKLTLNLHKLIQFVTK